MTQEQLEKANEIAKQLEWAKRYLKRAEYTQSENVVSRKVYLDWVGSEGNIEIPSSLFRIIGKLVVAEYSQEIIKLEKELAEL